MPSRRLRRTRRLPVAHFDEIHDSSSVKTIRTPRPARISRTATELWRRLEDLAYIVRNTSRFLCIQRQANIHSFGTANDSSTIFLVYFKVESETRVLDEVQLGFHN